MSLKISSLDQFQIGLAAAVKAEEVAEIDLPVIDEIPLFLLFLFHILLCQSVLELNFS